MTTRWILRAALGCAALFALGCSAESSTSPTHHAPAARPRSSDRGEAACVSEAREITDIACDSSGTGTERHSGYLPVAGRE
jgi:hypothetical protein